MLRFAFAGPSRLPVLRAAPIPLHRPSSSIPALSFTRNASSTVSAEKPIKDEAIPHSTVQVLDPATNEPSPPTLLASLLDAIKGKRHKCFYQLISNDPAPIVKLVQHKDEALRRREAKAAGVKPKGPQLKRDNEAKTVTLTWSTEPRDLQHKLEQAKEALRRREPVKVLLSPKRKVRLPSDSERKALLNEVVETLKEDSAEPKVEFRNLVASLLLRPRPVPK